MTQPLHVWRARYREKVSVPGSGNSNGFEYMQDVTRLLIATPYAVLHYKIVRTKNGERIFTDVKAMSQQWFSDAIRKMRGDPLFVAVSKAAAKNGGSFEMRPADNLAQLLEDEGITDLVASNEKAKAAFSTALGGFEELRAGAVWKKAEEETKARREEERLARTQKVKEVDPMWGIF